MQQHKPTGRKTTAHRLAALLASLGTLTAAQAAAPWMVTHGPVEAQEIPALPASFNSRFPASKFEVFIYSDAFIVGGLQACHAIVGVSPRGSFQFPIHHYSTSQTRPGPEGGAIDDPGEHPRSPVFAGAKTARTTHNRCYVQ